MTSLVVSIMDRLGPVEHTISSWIKVRGLKEIVIVDWSSEQDVLSEYAKMDPRITVARVEGEPFFNHSRSKNLGVHIAKSDWIFITDGDVLVSSDFLEKAGPERFSVFQRGWGQGLYGSILVAKEKFLSVGGYDERFKGWGLSDDDLYARLEHTGMIRTYISADTLHHVEHDETYRHNRMETGVRNRKESQTHNADIIQNQGEWNAELYTKLHKPIEARLISSPFYLPQIQSF